MITSGPSRLRQSAAGPSKPPTPPSIARSFFPGFLAASDDEDDREGTNRAYLQSVQASSSPKSPSSPSVLPYLRDSPTHSPSRSSPRANIVLDEPQPRSTAASASSSTSTSARAPPIRSGPSSTALSPRSTGSAKSPLGKKRPSPLDLKLSPALGQDEELREQKSRDGLPRPAIAIVTDSGEGLQDLSSLRKSVRKNLLARPLESPLAKSDSTGYHTPDPDDNPPSQPGSSLSTSDDISVPNVLDLLHSSSQLLALDTRPLGSFLESHFPRSANVSIPTLIFKRFRKATGAQATWSGLGSFISTSAGKEVWAELKQDEAMDVVVVGQSATDETAKVLANVMAGLVERGSVRVLRGGWGAVMASTEAAAALRSGEDSLPLGQSRDPSNSLPPPRSSTATRGSDLQLSGRPPLGEAHPSPDPPTLALRVDAQSRRTLPTLSAQAGISRRPPKLALNVDPPRSASLGAFPQTSRSDRPLKSPGLLTINTGGPSRVVPALSVSAPKSPLSSSFQALCLAQSKLPPSPSSFGDIKHDLLPGDGDDLTEQPSPTPGTSWTAAHTARPGALRTFSRGGGFPDRPRTAGLPSAKNAIAPFIVSTILPQFLFLGPEISDEEDVQVLVRLGVKRILNVALECEDDELRLRERFERYLKVPMRDIVEESGVAKGMRDACEFLDDARLHSAPTYVHCKAGKSRSVTVVLAYLIHANAWTLKTSYAYVAERRKGISPNIGFVAELMQFEETELGLKQSGGVHGEGGGRKAGGSSGAAAGRDSPDADEARKPARYARESLPPAWAASLDSRPVRAVPPGAGEGRAESGREDGKESDRDRRQQMGDEREVRKNGHWVHHRRAPVDRTTLQPGRRVSKAGLESLRPLTTDASGLTPQPSPGAGDGGMGREAATPGGEGRIGWV